MELKTMHQSPVITIVSILSEETGYALRLSHNGDEKNFHLCIDIEHGLGSAITGFERVSQWLSQSNNAWAVRSIGQVVMRFAAGEEPEFPFMVVALDEVFSFARPLSWCVNCRNGRLFAVKEANGQVFLKCEHCKRSYYNVDKLGESHGVETQMGELPSPATDDELKDSQWRKLLPREKQ